jgi:hypothetical protein
MPLGALADAPWLPPHQCPLEQFVNVERGVVGNAIRADVEGVGSKKTSDSRPLFPAIEVDGPQETPSSD